MGNFLGGSAWAMVQGMAEGHHNVTERTFRSMSRGQLDQLSHELERQLRDARGDQPPIDDLDRVKARNRKIQRLNSARMIMLGFRQRNRV
jgi:hypothetical protein